MGLYHVVIVGGGTAGWMAGAALAKFLPKDKYTITLVESDQIGTVGVGEATIPHIRHFNQMLGIDENDFIHSVKATYKLGIQFENWGKDGDSYIHPFGRHGIDPASVEFHHCWLKLSQVNKVLPFDNYSLASMAAKHNRFMYPSEDPRSIFSSYSYAFHIDAGLYARYLRTYAERRGILRKEGVVNGVELNSETGCVKALSFNDGSSVSGNFFIDCSGFAGMLIEKVLKSGFENWSKWLPCDSAVAIPSSRIGRLRPYTRAIACDFGWRWQIPLQHRTGNGYVYSSKYIDDDAARDFLEKNLDAPALSEARLLRFTPGQRSESWKKNCVAIGLSSGFLEPLESTSIYLIQIAILKLLEFFPGDDDICTRSTYFNKAIKNEYELIRDFLILHYRLNSKTDSAFWNYCATMELPVSLNRKMALFKEAGVIEHYDLGLFMPPSWLSVYLGQGLLPSSFDPRSHLFNNIEENMRDFELKIKNSVLAMPDAQDFLEKVSGVKGDAYPQAALSLYGGISASNE